MSRPPGTLRGGRRPSRWSPVAVATSLLLTAVACVSQAPPEPAEVRSTPPPWDAPRDAVSYITAARLEPLPLDLTENSRTLHLTVTVDGEPVPVPGYLGIDRIRSVQAAVHTHDDSGTLWLEGKGSDDVTLGQLFVLWGVRLDASCLGAACGGVSVTTEPAAGDVPPLELRLARFREITVAGRTR